MAISVINRVRFTAWAWLASAFLLGTGTGVLAAGVPLWKQLQAAKDDAARLDQIERLTRHVEPGADADALASLEETPRVSASRPSSLAQQGAPVEATVPGPAVAQQVASPPVAQVRAPTAEVALAAPQPVPAPAVSAAPAKVASPAGAASRGSTEAERKAVEAREAAQAAEAAERKAKAERLAKLEREQKLAREAQQKKVVERQPAEPRTAAAPPKPPIDIPVRKDPLVQLAAPVPTPGANAPTERVTKDEAGLSEVQAGVVTFKSGRRVAVGESFPSGEKLISVDPAIGEIITSRRRIVIKPAGAAPGVS